MNTEDVELKFIKLDRRHRGFEEFKHYVIVEPKPTHRYRPGERHSFSGYLRLREVCTNVWGFSCERELYLKLKHERPNMELNNHWVWHTDINNGQYRIYLKSDQEKAWLLLQW